MKSKSLILGLLRYRSPLAIRDRVLSDAIKIEATKYGGSSVLDIGCGSKPYERVFPKCSSYLGLDLPSTASSRANIYGTALQLPFKMGVFDTVLCTEVLEHVTEPGLLFKESYRVLKTGGYLILSAPQVWGIHFAPADYYRFTPFGLRYLAESANFDVVEVKPTCGIWATIGQRVSSFAYYQYAYQAGKVKRIFIQAACGLILIFSDCLDKLFKRELPCAKSTGRHGNS